MRHQPDPRKTEQGTAPVAHLEHQRRLHPAQQATAHFFFFFFSFLTRLLENSLLQFHGYPHSKSNQVERSLQRHPPAGEAADTRREGERYDL